MTTRRFAPFAALALVLALVTSPWALAADAGSKSEKSDKTSKAESGKTEMREAGVGTSILSTTGEAARSTSSGESKPKYPAFSEVLKDAQPIEGFLKLYRKESRLYAEVGRGQLNTDMIVIISIARGIGRSPLLGGMSWGFGNDWLWQFRKVDDRIQVVRRNVRFRANDGSPLEKAVRMAYTDSILFSLPIATVSPAGADVVDLTPIFMSDLPQISPVLPGFSFASDRSTWAAVKGFKDNVELEVAATYASSGAASFDTVADSRGVTINVHYSISRLPQTGYQTRPADDRVGYFISVVKDYSNNTDRDHFVRYINRWDLRKAEPSAALSPPVTPIIFWIEKTVPFKYRKVVREGILEWNKAFEQAGFANAVEVRQQPDDATWDPEDVNYNTFRWITAAAKFAMGPTRVNPITGQILDSDIIFDADFLEAWRETYDIITPESAAAMTGGPVDLKTYQEQMAKLPPQARQNHGYLCECAQGMARQFAFGATVLAAGPKPPSSAQLEEILMQGIRATVTHEVGHTLGLRHNFKASAYLSQEELSDPDKTKANGLASSVMDYLPMNLCPKGQKQGAYFNTVIGPYDFWAIEYGYRPIAGGGEAESAELKKIASRSSDPALAYGTDEDTRGIDPDPLANRFDLGKDPLAFARRQATLVAQAMPGFIDRVIKKGDDYVDARRAFNILLSQWGNAMHFTARYVGGVYIHRDHKGDPSARPPQVVVEPQKQREAMDLLEQQVFGPESLQFSAAAYNYLAASNWNHWGTDVPGRVDYPVHETIAVWQDRVLGQLLSPLTLSRLMDGEAKIPAEQDAFTAAELLSRLTAAIFRETEKLQDGKFTARKPAINSLRRSLQRRHLQKLADLALGTAPGPEDCQTLAYAELTALEGRLNKVLQGKAELDPYTRAHLAESAARIHKILDARAVLPGFPSGGSSVIFLK